MSGADPTGRLRPFERPLLADLVTVTLDAVMPGLALVPADTHRRSSRQAAARARAPHRTAETPLLAARTGYRILQHLG